MRRKIFTLLGLMLGFCLMACSASGVQSRPGFSTAWGHPDLQGVWDYRSVTPLETPSDITDQAAFTEQQALEFEQTADARLKKRFASLSVVGSVGDEPWADRGQFLTEGTRTSLIIDPVDGKLPARTEIGKKRPGVFFAQMIDVPDGPEDRTLGERCIAMPNLPFSSGTFNSNVQIFQTPDYVILLHEMIHHARIVPLFEQNTPPFAQWLGQSRGFWDGDTLVIQTQGFRDHAGLLGTSPAMVLTEKFTRISAEQLSYEYTVDDPVVFTAPWTARQTFNLNDGKIYEFACHEGNRSLGAILRGARLAEG